MWLRNTGLLKVEFELEVIIFLILNTLRSRMSKVTKTKNTFGQLSNKLSSESQNEFWLLSRHNNTRIY